MPQDLFKWEDGGGLKHHCPICQTPLSHDKCRTVCLGNHVEWCHRYHCLFRKNWSSRCSACKTTDEQHEKRHREIAEILAKIKKYKAEEEAAAMELLASPTAPKTPRTPLTAKALNSVGGISPMSMETPKTTKKERKAMKKAAKNLDREKVVTTQDIEFIARTLHPKSEKELVEDVEMEEAEEDMEIKMNLKFNNSTCNAKSARHDFIIRDREQSDVDNGKIKNLLVAMDVDPQATGKEGELVRELGEAIKNDLIHFHDELKIVARNKGGFWRWANKRAYRDLVENGKDWDAKHKHDGVERASISDERRPSEQSVDTEGDDETAPSRSGSIGSSAAPSIATALTVPSTNASSKKRASDANIQTPSSKKKTEVDDGWTQVGKKVLKPAQTGKLTLATNGGLHHLAAKPKKNVWSVSDLK